MNEPLDLAPELARKKRVEDLDLMKKREKKHQFITFKEEVKDVMVELNLRYSQYSRQSQLGRDFKILQTVYDFQNILTPLQPYGKKKQTLRERIEKAKVDYLQPIAQIDKKIVYINQDKNAFEVFTYAKPE